MCCREQVTAAGLVQGARRDADHLGVTLTPRPGGIARSRQHLKTTRFLRFFRRLGSAAWPRLRRSTRSVLFTMTGAEPFRPRDVFRLAHPHPGPNGVPAIPQTQRLHLSAMENLFPQQMQNIASKGLGWLRPRILVPDLASPRPCHSSHPPATEAWTRHPGSGWSCGRACFM